MISVAKKQSRLNKVCLVLLACSALLWPVEVVAQKKIIEVEELVIEANLSRVNEGLLPLKPDIRLNMAAQAKAEDMLSKGYWDHYDLASGGTPWDFIKGQGYLYQTAGENLARGFSTAELVIKGWLSSQTHKDNLLNPNYTHVGYGLVYSDLLPSDKQPMVVQLLAEEYNPVLENTIIGEYKSGSVLEPDKWIWWRTLLLGVSIGLTVMIFKFTSQVIKNRKIPEADLWRH